MILVTEKESKNKGTLQKECILAAHDREDVRTDIQAVFAAILENTEVTMIFLEELSHIQPILEERIKDVQNSFSNSDREQNH